MRTLGNGAATATVLLSLFFSSGSGASLPAQAGSPAQASASVPTSAPVAPSAPAGDVVGLGNFGHTVASLEKSVQFYHDVLGLELARPPAPFAVNEAISRMTDTVGGQSRIAVMKIPGATWGVELIDYKDVERTPAHPRFQDPGAANLSLRVRDLDPIMAALKGSGGSVLTLGGQLSSRGGKARVIFLQDPDGFVVEINQPDPLPDATAQAPGNVTGGSIEITVGDAEKAASFYHDVLGFLALPSGNASYNGDKTMTDTAGTPGAQFRQRRVVVPGTSTAIGFMEFKSIDRQPLHTRASDPGAAVLQLRVRDAAAVMNALKTAGASIVSVGGQPADLGNNVHIAIVRDPNNLFLELIQPPPAR
jgi:catechol 2,3-dioxygenase-like lactoylglutathione lyase family enzyme